MADDVSLGLGSELDTFDDFDALVDDPQQSSPCTEAQRNARIEGVPPKVDVKRMFPDSDEQATPTITSAIAYGHCGRPLDLRKLAVSVRNTEYVPKKQLLTLRLREPTCVVSIRASGSLQVMGAANAAAARIAITLTAQIIRIATGLTDELKQVAFALKSFTVRFDLKHPIRLEELHHGYPEICSFEPESFCACHVKLSGLSEGKQWNVTAAVFVSGKVVMTGGNSSKSIEWAYNALLPLLAKYAHGAECTQGILRAE